MSNESSNASLLRELPSVASLIELPPLKDAAARFGQAMVTSATRSAITDLRQLIMASPTNGGIPQPEQLAGEIAARLEIGDNLALRPVINATGILLHTGLGRAPLAEVAVQAAATAAGEYCNVELDLASGLRTQRSQSVADLLCQLTGADAAHVVNNNAGALGLILAAQATGQEVIVSHGELIEIGGGYRLPDVIEAFGARLRPVGTTNKTRLSDYAKSIGEQTGAILVVHPSNYRIAGFTEQPQLSDLAALARQHGIPLIHDIGSGALIDISQFGCSGEPIASDSIEAGADLVLFSGDKLLGGPQCGIVVGKKEATESLIRHPLSRALRVDKITMAALRATLQLYRRPEEAMRSIPLLRFLRTPAAEIERRARALAENLLPKLTDWQIGVAEDRAYVGGGSLPQHALASWCLEIASTERCIQELAFHLRTTVPSVVGRIQKDRLVLNLHGVFADQDESLSAALEATANSI